MNRALALLFGAVAAAGCVGCGADPQQTQAVQAGPVAPTPDAQNLRRAIERIRRLAESGEGLEILSNHTYWPTPERPQRDALLAAPDASLPAARVSQLGAAMTIFLAREPEWLSATIARFDLSDVEERDVPRDAHFVWWNGDWRLLDAASDLDAFRAEESAAAPPSAGTTRRSRH